MASDPSYGRYLGPHHPKEKELELRPDLTIHRRRVFLDKDGNGVGKGHEVKLGEPHSHIHCKTGTS